MLLQVALALASIHLSHTLIILPSRDAGGVGLAFMGRSDMQPADYVSFLQGLQASLSESHNTSATVVIAANLAELQTGVASATGQYGVQRWFGTGHSMSGGGAALQDFVRANSTTFSGLILIAAFAKRTQRPDVRACLAKATVQPQRSFANCPEHPPLHPGGSSDRSTDPARCSQCALSQVRLVPTRLPCRWRSSVQRGKHRRLPVADPHHRWRVGRGNLSELPSARAWARVPCTHVSTHAGRFCKHARRSLLLIRAPTGKTTPHRHTTTPPTQPHPTYHADLAPTQQTRAHTAMHARAHTYARVARMTRTHAAYTHLTALDGRYDSSE